MNRLIWSGFLAVLLVSGCGWNGTPTRHNDFIPLTSIKILAAVPAIEASHTIAALTSTKLTVIGDFSGIFTRDITDQVTWSSSNTPVADFKFSTTPNTNRISGLAAGTATLTATMGGVSATYSLTISNATVSTIAISPPAPSVPQGLTTQFSAIGTFSDTTTQDLTFDVAWSSSPGTFATISNASASKGFATALVAGTGTETISASFGVAPTTANASATMTVTAPALQSITVTPANPSILSLSTTGFKATGNFSDGTAPDITNQVTWSSSNINLATINTGGGVSTIAQGTTIISATLPSISGISGSTNLKVTGGKLNGITLSVANRTPVNNIISLINGTTSRVIAIGSFDNGSTRDITGAVSWSVADPTKASISITGSNLAWLTTKAETTTPTTISATTTILNPTTNLTVIPVLQSIAIPAPNLNLNIGTSGRLTVSATFNDGTTATQDFTASCTWASSNTSVATVDNSLANKGRITGVGAGSATITATAPFTGLVPVTATVTVAQQRNLLNLKINPSPVTIGNKAIFVSTANYDIGPSIDVTDDTTWSIDSANVAILADSTNQPGQIVGVDRGTATLTATFGSKTATAPITVP